MTKKKKMMWISGAALATALVVGGAGVATASTTGDDDAVTGTAFDQASTAALAEVGEGTVESVESSDDGDHTYEVEVRLENNNEVEVELDENFTVIRTETDEADNDDDSDQADSDDASNDDMAAVPLAPLTDAERASATAAALAEVGEGTVTEVERSDEAGHAFEVDIDLADGTDVDVELDESFVVLSVER